MIREFARNALVREQDAYRIQKLYALANADTAHKGTHIVSAALTKSNIIEKVCGLLQTVRDDAEVMDGYVALVSHKNKSAFLAATPGVDLSIHFQKKVGAGFFGGEGFIMQKLSGHGMAFLEIDGSAVEYTLAPGQQIIVDTGNLAMVDATCQIDIQTVRGAKNVLFGGEGLFNTVVTGPGRVVLQTMALPAFASALIPYLPAKSD